MGLVGRKGSPFNVDVTMDDPINEVHTVVHTPIGSIIINSGNNQEFTPSDYDEVQQLNVTGNIVGVHKMRAVSTTPYYVDSSGRQKETVTEYNLEIVDYFGWELYNTSYAQSTTKIGCAKLHIASTAPSHGYGGTFSVGKTGGGTTTNSLTFFLRRPDGSTVACDTDLSGVYAFVANQVGTYYLYFCGRSGAGAYTASHTQSISLTASVGNEATFDATTLFYVDAGTGATMHALVNGTTSGMTTPLWTSHNPLVVPVLVAGGWFSPSGFAGSLSSWDYTDITPGTLTCRSFLKSGPSTGGSVQRNYGYEYEDPTDIPAYDGISKAWSFGVSRVSNVLWDL